MTDCMTVNGRTIGENIAGSPVHDREVIRALDRAIYGEGATAVLYGNIAPKGCVMKPAAAEKRFLKHTGPALVFRDYNEMAANINRSDLDVTPDHAIVLQNAGPVGGPGMPEWGMLPIPQKLLEEGVRDMLRISDARMSGTSYGACVLHVSPESHIGGPLAAVRTGDIVSIDVEKRRIDVKLSEGEIKERLAQWSPPLRDYPRGYNRMFAAHITQAHEGCDFDFLEGTAALPEPEIH
jgi:dihydroxy-acid dehydratase